MVATKQEKWNEIVAILSKLRYDSKENEKNKKVVNMHLKKLELQGFKSFADKTILEFMPGITSVIGPNGSRQK